MYQTINGWTKATMKAAIRAGNNGQRAVDSPTSALCRYLTADGNRCAVGCFIPDGHEGAHLRGAVDDLLYSYPDLKDKMPLSPSDMWSFQRVHDSIRAPVDMHVVLETWIDANVVDGEVTP
jgi:hypothetical protein